MPPTPNPSPPDDDRSEAYDRAEKTIRAAQAALDRASVSSPEIPEQLRGKKPAGVSPLASTTGGKSGGATTTSSMSVAYGLAFELGVYLIVCAGAGWLVDTYAIGSGRTWTVVGAMFGLVGGMVRTIRGASAMYKAMDAPPKGHTPEKTPPRDKKPPAK